MKKILSIIVALASTFVFAQQITVNDSISLNEVVVTAGRSTVDLAATRLTPVAVTVVSQQEIESKIGYHHATINVVEFHIMAVQNHITEPILLHL
jgi:outer membrane cobalamin receptor